MFAVVNIAGFQEMVKEGQTIKVPHLDAEKGKKVVFKDVLLMGKGDDLTFGSPMINGATVEVEVVSHGRADKVRVVRMRRRKRFRRVKGHRQQFTEVKVTKIGK